MQNSKITEGTFITMRRQVIIKRGRLGSHVAACKALGIGTTTGYLLLRAESYRHYLALRRRESGKSYTWRDRLVIFIHGK